jgi:hypothetical protein
MSFSGTDVVVILSALGAIALVNWYFFVAGRAPATATAGSAGAPAEVVITVGTSTRAPGRPSRTARPT